MLFFGGGGGEGGKFSARPVPLQALFQLEMTCCDSGDPRWDEFGMLTDLGPGQASVVSEHRLAFGGRALNRSCASGSWNHGYCLQIWGKSCRKGWISPRSNWTTDQRSPPRGLSRSLCCLLKIFLKITLTATVRAALCCPALVFWSSQVQGRDDHERTTQTTKQSRKISSCNSKVAHDFNSFILCVRGLFWGLYLK